MKAPNEGVIGVLLKIENWRNRAILVATDLLMARERENIEMAVTMLSRLSYCEGIIFLKWCADMYASVSCQGGKIAH